MVINRPSAEDPSYATAPERINQVCTLVCPEMMQLQNKIFVSIICVFQGDITFVCDKVQLNWII
jgi:hypothetical protein